MKLSFHVHTPFTHRWGFGDWEQLWGRIFTHVLLVIGGGLKLAVLWFFVHNTIFLFDRTYYRNVKISWTTSQHIRDPDCPPKSYLAVRFPQGPFGFEKFRWRLMYYSQRPQRRLPRWNWKIEKSKFHQINHFPFLDQYWRAIDKLTTQEELQSFVSWIKNCFFALFRLLSISK